MKTTRLQQLNQGLCANAQGLAQAGDAVLNLFPLSSHPSPANLPLQLAQQGAQPALPLHHLGACLHLNIRGETPQISRTS
ncbi:hypothetical protein ACO0K9_21975 [Undibacterium sp. Ji50W]|uniref:hypothetical protein n=1 Tax=Undibacterium sp. Ji50W TaxID=3413041 RepID=UPI003BF04C75